MRRRFYWLVLGLLVAALGLTAIGSAGLRAKPVNGGTVIFGADQEPAFLNTDLQGGNAFWAVEIVSPVFPSAFRVHPDFGFYPELVTKATTTTNPFTVTYYINKKAKWSDGKPITAADFIFGVKTIMNPNFKILSTVGYEDIDLTKTKVSQGGKVVKFVFNKPFAGWKTLFGAQAVLPAHALAGQDFNKVWINDLNNPKTGKPISGGPYYLQAWDRGKQVVLVRNTKFWGPRPHLDRVVYRFLPDTNTTATAIQSGDVDVIYPQPQPFLVPLRHNTSVKVQIGKGPVWEHIDFNMGRGTPNPELAKLYVRQAIAYGIDRTAIVKALYYSTDIAPGLPVLSSPIFMTNSKYYHPWFGTYTYSKAKAEAALKSHGCTKGGDGIYSCDGKRLSFRFAWTSGNQLRQLTFEIVQAQLKQVGIELTADDAPAGTLFGSKLPSGNYDLILFAWVGSPDVSGWDSIYGCRNDTAKVGQDNNQGYCNPQVTRDLQASNHIPDASTQAKVINNAISLMAKDVAIIPMFQKPTYLIARNQVKGAIENPTSEGPVWNIASWWKSKA